MRIETQFGAIEVSDIPNTDKLTYVQVNMQDQVVEFIYEGYVAPVYQPIPQLSPDAARYDGELDPPGMSLPTSTVRVEPVQPRRVKDVPQA